MKKILSILCTVACIFSLLAFRGSTVMAAEAAAYGGYDQSIFEQYVQGLYSTLTELTNEEIENYLVQGDESTIETMASWQDIKDQLGEYVELGEFTISESDGIIVAVQTVNYTSNNALITATFDSDLQVLSIVASLQDDEAGTSLGDKMSTAALNIVIGLVTVFVILTLIIFLISCFKYIGRIQDKFNKKQPSLVDTAAENATAQIVQTEKAVDDLELVAVISAAIAAAEGTSADGFVVRSIKRRKTW